MQQLLLTSLRTAMLPIPTSLPRNPLDPTAPFPTKPSFDFHVKEIDVLVSVRFALVVVGVVDHDGRIHRFQYGTGSGGIGGRTGRRPRRIGRGVRRRWNVGVGRSLEEFACFFGEER